MAPRYRKENNRQTELHQMKTVSCFKENKKTIHRTGENLQITYLIYPVSKIGEEIIIQ